MTVLSDLGYKIGSEWNNPSGLLEIVTNRAIKQLVNIRIENWLTSFSAFRDGFLEGIQINVDNKKWRGKALLGAFILYVEEKGTILPLECRVLFLHHFKDIFQFNCPLYTDNDKRLWDMRSNRLIWSYFPFRFLCM
jgi:hypothetical protein